MHKDPARASLPSMFSWLSTQIPEYPETLSLRMHARIQPPGMCLHFALEPTDHPLSREYYQGISAERVREIMLRRLRDPECGGSECVLTVYEFYRP